MNDESQMPNFTAILWAFERLRLLVGYLSFYGISIFVGYLMPNHDYTYISNI